MLPLRSNCATEVVCDTRAMTVRAMSPPLGADVGSAGSAQAGLHRLLSGRVAAVTDVGRGVAAELADLTAERSRLRVALRGAEAEWDEQLHAPVPSTRRMILAAQAQLQVCADLGGIEERLTTAQQRADDLATEAALLRVLISEVARAAAGSAPLADEDELRYASASRQLLSLIDADQDALTQRLVDGPLQALGDGLTSAELAEKLSADGRADEAVTEVHRCRQGLVSALDGCTEITDELWPPSLASGLSASIRDLLRRPDLSHSRFDGIGVEPVLPLSRALAIHRIVAEAVANAIRHGHATSVDVVLSFHRERIVLVVRDDGEGFDVSATEARLGRTRSLGLIGMRERAAISRVSSRCAP